MADLHTPEFHKGDLSPYPHTHHSMPVLLDLKLYKGDLHAPEYQDDDLASGHLQTFPISLLSQGQPALALKEELVTSVIICIAKAAKIASLNIPKDIMGSVSTTKATPIVLSPTCQLIPGW